jgi:hypothetical protein
MRSATTRAIYAFDSKRREHTKDDGGFTCSIRVSISAFVRFWQISRIGDSAKFFAVNTWKQFESHPLRQSLTSFGLGVSGGLQARRGSPPASGHESHAVMAFSRRRRGWLQARRGSPPARRERARIPLCPPTS